MGGSNDAQIYVHSVLNLAVGALFNLSVEMCLKLIPDILSVHFR